MRLEKHGGYWTCSSDSGDHCYYFAPVDRHPPPYLKQREVRAIIDIAEDGTLAGIDLIDDMPPPPATVCGRNDKAIDQS